jgi:hypothetical protein
MQLIGLCLCAAASSSADETYTNGFPLDPHFFPIGVWLQSPARAANYKAAGINTYIALWRGPTESQLAQLARNDMFAVTAQNEVGLNSVNRHVIKGWLQEDEPDNAQPTGLGMYGSCVPASDVAARTQAMKTRDATRPVMINFGQGIANEFWRGRGPCTGDERYYDIAIRGADILSFDFYPVGSGTPQVKGKLEYVARGVTNLVKRAKGEQRVWAILETTALDPAHRVMPAQLRAEAWMALIHGAKGIAYFVHEFSPKVREDAIFRHPDVVEEVTKINRLIKALAPVLNGPSLDGKVAVESTMPVATMVKLYANTLYIFAVGMTDSATTARFAIDGVGQATAHVIGDERQVNITNGLFEDSFPGYAVHLYEIPMNEPAR